ncbi:hypothetical protein A5699_11640 [Mycobacterium sp. E802]|nr:hypothetical protein A5699_11640 [Mycobacterium sp. E802]
MQTNAVGDATTIVAGDELDFWVCAQAFGFWAPLRPEDDASVALDGEPDRGVDGRTVTTEAA